MVARNGIVIGIVAGCRFAQMYAVYAECERIDMMMVRRHSYGLQSYAHQHDQFNESLIKIIHIATNVRIIFAIANSIKSPMNRILGRFCSIFGNKKIWNGKQSVFFTVIGGDSVE